MAARLSAKKLPRYSLEFKRKAVRLTQVPGMEVQAVAKGLDLHPVMLSRWRQEARLCRLRGRAEEPPLPKKLVRELKRLQELEKEHRLLQEEHELLKKAIRFTSELRARSSRSSRASGKASK